MDFEYEEPKPPEYIRVKCPGCKQKTGVEVVHGYPSTESFEAADRGDLVLAGCLLPDDGEGYNRQCTACGHRWGLDFGRRGRPNPYPDD